MFDVATLVLGGFGFIGALVVLIAGNNSQLRGMKCCTAKRGLSEKRDITDN